VHFPLKPFDLAMNLPPSFVAGVLGDALWRPAHDGGETFAAVLERSLGTTICQEFYFPYAEKVWGVAPQELDAEQARRRVSAGSITKMVRKVLQSVPGLRPPGAGRFYYPKQGYGQISQAYADAARALGARIELGMPVVAVEIEAGRAVAVVAGQDGRQARVEARQIFSTIPAPALVRVLSPAAPGEVRAAAAALRYRAMILVYLILEQDRFTEYDAHYFPGVDVPIARLSEPKNYGLAGQPGVTLLCAELPCSPDDEWWGMSDEALGAVVSSALERVHLTPRGRIRSVATRRLREAYPLYVRGYRAHLDRLDEWLGGIDGLLVLGRQGLFVHDNTHHTLAMAYAASDCLDAAGRVDRTRWREHRRAFEAHVVED
jgi:protoporphyrinogen oxidase